MLTAYAQNLFSKATPMYIVNRLLSVRFKEGVAYFCACPGAHTLGKARCFTFNSRLNGNSNADADPNVNLDFIQSLQQLCTQSNANTTLADLDYKTPSVFDNQYFVNLLSGEGLLTSDQVLVTGDEGTRELVESYVDDPLAFLEEFKKSMLRMGSLLPATGENGEIRRNCRLPNNFNQ